MKYEIIAKAAGGGMTAQVRLAPYQGKPPQELLDAVRARLTERWFREWTGCDLETVVVTCAPLVSAEDRPSG